MRRTFGLLASLAVLALVPSRADAQRYGRGTVNTPFGQFSMSDMQAAGGDPFAAEEMREQKQMMQYQQQLAKQQQQYMQQMAKQQKARQDFLKQHPEAAKAEFDAQTAALAAQGARRKKKSLTPNAAAKSKAVAGKSATTPATDAAKAKVPGAPKGN